MTANMELFSYNTYIFNEEELLIDVNSNTHACPNCLSKVGFELTEIGGMKGTLVECLDCNTIVLGVPEKEIGEGNTKELKEYGIVHAEWYL